MAAAKPCRDCTGGNISMWDLQRSTGCWGSPGSSRTVPLLGSLLQCQNPPGHPEAVSETKPFSQAEVSDSVHTENPNYCMQNQLKYILPYLRLSALHPGKTGIAQPVLPLLLFYMCTHSPCVLQDNNDLFHRAFLPVSHFPREIIRWAKSESIGDINSGMVKA